MFNHFKLVLRQYDMYNISDIYIIQPLERRKR